MNNQNIFSSSLSGRIMRRVWYAYGLSVIFNSFTLRGIILSSSFILFVKLVSVHSILLNLLAVQVGSVPDYLWSTVVETATNGEFLKLITLGAIVFSLLTFRLPSRQSAVSGQEMQTV